MGRLPVTMQVNVVVIDPRNPKNVYAAGPAGIFRSTDAGLTWEVRNAGLNPANFTALTVNPQKPDTMFAMTAEGVLYRSDDRALNWKSVPTKTP